MDRASVLNKVRHLDINDMITFHKGVLDIEMAYRSHPITVIPVGVKGLKDEDIDEE